MLVFGCSPVKRAQKYNEDLKLLKAQFVLEKKAIAAEAVHNFVLANPCNPVPEINLDSICSLYFKCPEVNDYSIDSIAIPPIKDSMHKTNQRTAVNGKPVRILVPWIDKRAVNLLQDSCTAKDSRIRILESILSREKQLTAEQKASYKKLLYGLLFGGLILFVLIGVGLIVFLKIDKT